MSEKVDPFFRVKTCSGTGTVTAGTCPVVPLRRTPA